MIGNIPSTNSIRKTINRNLAVTYLMPKYGDILVYYNGDVYIFYDDIKTFVGKLVRPEIIKFKFVYGENAFYELYNSFRRVVETFVEKKFKDKKNHAEYVKCKELRYSIFNHIKYHNRLFESDYIAKQIYDKCVDDIVAYIKTHYGEKYNDYDVMLSISNVILSKIN